MSAAIGSRIGFPLSKVSANDNFSAFCSMTSAIFNKIFDLSAGPVLPHPGAAL